MRFPVVIKPETVETTNGVSEIFDTFTATGNDNFHSGIFVLKVTSVSGGQPRLDVFVQRELPGGEWTDFIAFARVQGIESRLAIVVPGALNSGFVESPVQDTALPSGQVRPAPLATRMRVKWILGGTGVPSFTFSILADLFTGD